jgi:hypothetical protein
LFRPTLNPEAPSFRTAFGDMGTTDRDGGDAVRRSAELRRGDSYFVITTAIRCLCCTGKAPTTVGGRGWANGRRTGLAAASPLADVPRRGGRTTARTPSRLRSRECSCSSDPIDFPLLRPINSPSSQGMLSAWNQGSRKQERWRERAHSGSGSGEHPRAGRRTMAHGSSGAAPMGCRLPAARGVVTENRLIRRGPPTSTKGPPSTGFCLQQIRPPGLPAVSVALRE